MYYASILNKINTHGVSVHNVNFVNQCVVSFTNDYTRKNIYYGQSGNIVKAGRNIYTQKKLSIIVSVTKAYKKSHFVSPDIRNCLGHAFGRFV